jgi:hypothetical protein
MVELEGLPDTFLQLFWDEARSSTFNSMQAYNRSDFPQTLRTKHPQLFSDTPRVDLDDLREWLRQREDLIDLLDPTISEMYVMISTATKMTTNEMVLDGVEMPLLEGMECSLIPSRHNHLPKSMS